MASTNVPSNLEHLTERERECLVRCREAAAACERCADESVPHEGDLAECVRLCRDVADVASLHARALARGSAHREALAGLCATVCEDCTSECERHDHDHCRDCVDVLRQCAEACESMVA